MYDVERPFHRLINHFVMRIFHGAGEGDELQFSIPTLLGLLSVPASFGAIALLGKYSAILMSARPVNVYRVSISDEYFFIVYSMVITGAVVILRWDSLFPDRQDHDNLAALPLSTRQLFGASLSALGFLTVLFAVDINWASAFIFPLAVTAKYDTFAAYLEFFVAHGVTVILSSFFACFALLSIMGFTLLLSPKRYVRRVSIMVRIACGLGLIVILGAAFSTPSLLLSNAPPSYLSYIPPVWFLDLHQSVLDLGSPLTGTAVLALQATGLSLIVALLAYSLAYYRYFVRIPEQSDPMIGRGRNRYSILRRIIDRFALRSPFQRATYHFAMKTLFRSERHCLLFGLAASIGFFFAAQTVSNVVAAPLREGVDARLLSVSLTLAYFIIVSVRALFDVPTDRNANWVFRSLLDPDRHEARSVGTKIALSLVAPWLLLVGLPVHVVMFGWQIALLHTGYVLVSSVVLAELLLFRFRKIPFTCIQTSSKDRVLVLIILSMFGLSLFGGTNARLEASVLDRPLSYAFVIAVFVAVIVLARGFARENSLRDRSLIFEDRPAPLVQVLELSKLQKR